MSVCHDHGAGDLQVMLGGRGGRKEGAARPVTDCEGRIYCEINSRNVLFKLVITSI